VNYIRWFPGDYLRDTIHLTWDEDLAYRRLLDAYYASDGNLPVDLEKLYAIVRADNGSRRKAVLKVVQEFFKRKSGKLIQKRARREMKRWRDFRIKCATAGKRSAAKRLSGNQPSTNLDASLAQPTLSPTPTPTPLPQTASCPNSSSSRSINKAQEERESRRPSLHHVLLENVILDRSMIDFAQTHHIDPNAEFQRLLDYNRARGNTVLHDVHAVWRRWIDSAVNYKKSNGESGPTIQEQIQDYERRTGNDIYTGKRKAKPTQSN
jgi:uncharacterized protein YdaU (DUF1376 family)